MYQPTEIPKLVLSPYYLVSSKYLSNYLWIMYNYFLFFILGYSFSIFGLILLTSLFIFQSFSFIYAHHSLPISKFFLYYHLFSSFIFVSLIFIIHRTFHFGPWIFSSLIFEYLYSWSLCIFSSWSLYNLLFILLPFLLYIQPFSSYFRHTSKFLPSRRVTLNALLSGMHVSAPFFFILF